VAGYHSLRPVSLYAELAGGKEEKGKDSDEGEGSDDTGVLPEAVTEKMIRDECYRRLPAMVLIRRSAAIPRPVRGF
jgi:hypothetical protein